MASITPISTSRSMIRTSTTVLPPSPNTPSFLLGQANKSYRHQYSNIYFVRLRLLRQVVEEKALERWKNAPGKPVLVPRVLEVAKSRLCYIVGTVYMDMPLKPNVMEDIARDNSIPPPPPLKFFYSADDNIMLEDESGRIRLVGQGVQDARLVTGVIIGALGIETPSGDFEVVDICYAGMAPSPASSIMIEAGQEDLMDVDPQPYNAADEWIAVVSGLSIGSTSLADAQIQLLVEYLTGEGGGINEQVSASQISRIIIAGNSLASISVTGRGESTPAADERKSRRHGADTSNFSPNPILHLSAHLLDIGRVMPIHILPGDTDPSGTIMPQQPLPRAMFGDASKLSTFFCETNPAYVELASTSDSDALPGGASGRTPMRRTLLVNSGQPLNDMFKYLPTPPSTRLSILEATLRWRHMAPTAPDTLWCHPYFAADPFIMSETPDIYIVGGQKKFGTKLAVESTANASRRTNEEKRCRIVMVPSFNSTGTLVLVNLRTLGVKCINFTVDGMTGTGPEPLQQETSHAPSAPPVEPMLSAPKSDSSLGL